MDEHANVQQLRDALQAYAEGDFDRFGSYIADDVLWHVGGRHRFSGDYRGRAAVLDYFREVQDVTSGTLALELDEVLADEEYGAITLQVTGQRAGRGVDVTMAEAIRFDAEGRWVEFWALADDQAAIDAFWGGDDDV